MIFNSNLKKRFKGEDVVSLYGTPKEEIPPTSAGRSENGSFNFAAANGNQVSLRLMTSLVLVRFDDVIDANH